MPSLHPKPKTTNPGSFLSRLVGGRGRGFKENEPYIPFRERYASSRSTTANTEDIKEPIHGEQQTDTSTGWNIKYPTTETFRIVGSQEHVPIPMQESRRPKQPPGFQTASKWDVDASDTLWGNMMGSDALVVDTAAVMDGRIRFQGEGMSGSNSWFEKDQFSHTATEGNQNVTTVRRLVRQNHSPIDGGLEFRQRGMQQSSDSSPMAYSGIYGDYAWSTTNDGTSMRSCTPPGANKRYLVGVETDGKVHLASRDHTMGTGYTDMSFNEDGRVISHEAPRDKGKAKEIDDTQDHMHSRSISYPESSNAPKDQSPRRNAPGREEYLLIPNNPFLPLPATPESVTSLPKIYPDKDGFLRVIPSASSGSAYPSNRLQNSNTMPSSPRNHSTPSTSFSKFTVKGIQSASSSNYDISIIDDSAVYSNDTPAVVQAPAPATPLNKRVMQLSATTPEKQMTPPAEVRKMKSSATTTSEIYSAPNVTGYGAVSQVQKSLRMTSSNKELQSPVIPRYVASGPSRGQNILHNDPIQARRYEGGRHKPSRAAAVNHQKQPPMLDPKPEMRSAIPPQQQSQYAGFVKLEDIQEMDREPNQAEKQRLWEEKQRKRTGLLSKGASKFGAGGFRRGIRPKTPKVAESVGYLRNQSGARASSDRKYHQPQQPEPHNQAAAMFKEVEGQSLRGVELQESEVPAMNDNPRTFQDTHRDARARALQDHQYMQQQKIMNPGPGNTAVSSQPREIPILPQQFPQEVPLQASPARFPVLHSPPGIVQEPSSAKICQSSQSVPKPWESTVNPHRARLTARVEAEICLDNEDIDTAIEWYESIKDDAVHTNKPHVLFNLGQLNMLKSDHDTAEEYFRQAVELDEYLLPGYMQLAYLAYWDEDFDLADSYWEKALHCLVAGRQEVDYETVGLAYSCSYTDIWWNKSAAQNYEHGMQPSKVPFGAIFRVPGFQANALECVLGDTTVRERRPWEFGGEGRVLDAADPEERRIEFSPGTTKTWVDRKDDAKVDGLLRETAEEEMMGYLEGLGQHDMYREAGFDKVPWNGKCAVSEEDCERVTSDECLGAVDEVWIQDLEGLRHSSHISSEVIGAGRRN
ncbi:hypothetical protein BZA77DRAFT_297754 [Pyronema omphalodes]|nr:hypothetical protein BZA77DRAFT_297754 [Pyronema omphalodes]